MPFAAALSTTPATARAVEEVCTEALARLQGKPDLAVLFFSPHHLADAAAFAAAYPRLGARCLIGCGGEAVAGNDQEVEGQPAVSLWLARWDRPVGLEPFHLVLEETSGGHSLI